MRRFYMVSLQHKNDSDVHCVFVTFSSKSYSEFEAYLANHLAQNANFAEIRRVSIISVSKYEEYKEFNFNRSLACLKALYEQKKKQERKGFFKQLFVV